MKYIKYKTDAQGGDENVFWVTMSDLLLGLVVVFLVLFVFAITGFTQNKVNEHEKQYEVTEKIAQELQKNNIKVVKVNVDDSENLAIEYGAYSIPTLVVIKDGNEINRSIGVISKEEVLKLLVVN